MQVEQVTLPDVEWYIDERIFVKQMLMERALTYVPKHKHDYDHASFLATGSVRLWRDDELVGDFNKPGPITIKAGVFHTFMSLEPNTLLYCIHQTNGDEVEISEFQNEIRPAILAEGV